MFFFVVENNIGKLIGITSDKVMDILYNLFFFINQKFRLYLIIKVIVLKELILFYVSLYDK